MRDGGLKTRYQISPQCVMINDLIEIFCTYHYPTKRLFYIIHPSLYERQQMRNPGKMSSTLIVKRIRVSIYLILNCWLGQWSGTQHNDCFYGKNSLVSLSPNLHENKSPVAKRKYGPITTTTMWPAINNWQMQSILVTWKKGRQLKLTTHLSRNFFDFDSTIGKQKKIWH